MRDGILYVSPIFRDLVGVGGSVNAEFIASYIRHGPQLYSETLLAGVHAQHGREELTADESGFRIQRYPTKHRLRENAADSGNFGEELMGAIESEIELHQSGDDDLVEYSGGIDSSLVLLAARARYDRVRTFAIQYGGLVGQQQATRRRRYLGFFNATDQVVMHDACRPFTGLMPSAAAGIELDLYAGPYVAAISHLQPPRGFLATALSGIGGDELFQTSSLPSAPAREMDADGFCIREHPRFSQYIDRYSYVDSSLFVQSYASATMHLRQGRIYVSPFLAPSVVAAGKRLPPSLKRGKTIAKSIIERKTGIDASYTNPPLRETFRKVFIDDLHEFDFYRFYRHSELFRQGLVDIDYLHSQHEALLNGGTSQIPHINLLFIAKVEIALQALKECGTHR